MGDEENQPEGSDTNPPGEETAPFESDEGREAKNRKAEVGAAKKRPRKCRGSSDVRPEEVLEALMQQEEESDREQESGPGVRPIRSRKGAVDLGSEGEDNHQRQDVPWP